MEEMNCIQVIVEKEKYAKHGVHKGMQGYICYNECVNDSWLVSFPRYGEEENIATIGISIPDMESIPYLDAQVNEEILRKNTNII